MDPKASGSFVVEGFYRDVLGEFSTYKNLTSKGTCSHWVVPTPNLSSQILAPYVPFDSRFKYKISRPKPFLSPTHVNPKCFKEGDPFETIVREKEKWENDLYTLTQDAKKGKKWADKLKYGLTTCKISKKDAKKPIYTLSGYVNVAKHIAKDPYPYFSGNYNWLGTGGCITSTTMGGVNIILHPSGKHMDTLCMTRPQHEGDKGEGMNTESVTHLPLIQGQRIYQIIGKHIKNSGIVCIRQQKATTVVRLKTGKNKKLVGRVLLEIEDKDGAFTSIDMNPSEEHQLCTLDADRFLKLWDLNTSSCLTSIEMPQAIEQSSWGYVKFSNKSNEIFVVDRNTVFVKDQRMPLTETSMEFSPRSVVDDCEEISLVLNSLRSPLVYVSTSHQLLSLDLRFGWHQRWTHLLQAPPMYGSVFCDSCKSDEVIILSSSVPDDVIVIANKWKEGKAVSDVTPIGVPSLGDCLLLARARGKCLDPTLNNRLEMATAGLTVLCEEDSSKFTCLRATSIGDVFSQTFQPATEMFDLTGISEKEDEIQADLDTWQRWEDEHNEICSRVNPDLRCPTISNDFIFNTIKVPSAKDKKSSIKKWHETFSKKESLDIIPDSSSYAELLCELGSYKDLMAEVLLGAWDTQGLTTQLEPRHYVESWLDNCPSSTPKSPEDEDDMNLSITSGPTTTPRLMSSSSYDRRFDTERNDEDQVFKTPLIPNLRPRKKIKRESLGF